MWLCFKGHIPCSNSSTGAASSDRLVQGKLLPLVAFPIHDMKIKFGVPRKKHHTTTSYRRTL
eukprot:3519991-Amphidinium_carterae.1